MLGRDALTRRFYRTLEGSSPPSPKSPDTREPVDRREIALLWLSRLLFLSFLETKGWLDGDRRFLARHFEARAGRAGGAHRRFLLPLFFGTLNTAVHRRAEAARDFGTVPFLNGGLFARSSLERRHSGLHFPDDALGRVFDDLLTRYRFTAREDDVQWSDAAVDPEMLGKAFESLMASRARRESAPITPRMRRIARTEQRFSSAGASGLRDVTSLRAEGGSVDLTTAALLRERALE